MKTHSKNPYSGRLAKCFIDEAARESSPSYDVGSGRVLPATRDTLLKGLMVLVTATLASCATPPLGGVWASDKPVVSEAERADIRRLYESGNAAKYSVKFPTAVVDRIDSATTTVPRADLDELARVRLAVAAFKADEAAAGERKRQAEQNRRDNEEAIARNERETRERERAYRESPAGRREAYKQDIATNEDCVKKAQAAIDKQTQIAKASGFVDKQVMYFAGKFMVECKSKLDELRKACKAEKLC